MTLRADPSGLAPERLLVFELTSDIQKFARAAAHVPGLEFIGAEELEGDEADKSPALYLLIPDAAAMRQMVGLWRRYQAEEAFEIGFAPWRALFEQLRDLRPWGPQDRLSAEDAEFIAWQAADSRGMVRIELELVFRAEGGPVEAAARDALARAQGELISSCRIAGAKYHALLVDVPQTEVGRLLAGTEGSLAYAEAVMHVRPQSVLHAVITDDGADGEAQAPLPLPAGAPIAAIFDSAPLSGHPRLAGRLTIEDPFDLEPLAIGPRAHGTAMASAVLHGDLSGPALAPLERPVYFLNVMYAEAGGEERFPDMLPADLFHQAVLRMKAGPTPSAPGVVVVNASLGDRSKPFFGRMSAWARVIDHLAFTYGLLFVVSAGNQMGDLVTDNVNTIAFEALDHGGRARAALKASGGAMAHRRVLAPAESMNALTVGALHSDQIAPGGGLAGIFDVWQGTGLSTVSSGLGPGIGNSVKPDVLAPGGRHHVRLMPAGHGHLLRPVTQNSPLLGGIKVAAPPSGASVNPDRVSQSIGTSVAAALLTGAAARVHEALEVAYDDFLMLPAAQRAALLKAMLVHSARWTHARDLIVEILGPADNKQHVRQKDNIRRYLGYGATDPSMVLECAADRATLWSVGRLTKEQSHTHLAPLPAVISGKVQPHEVSCTVAWFAPPRLGSAVYRGARLRLLEPETSKEMLAVKAEGLQPDSNQAHKGTVIHRRWQGDKAAHLGEGAALELVVQREPDETDDDIAYAIVATIHMAGVAEVYAQVRDRLAIKPKSAVLTPA